MFLFLRKSFLFLLVICMSVNLNATVHTVSNASGSIAMYDNVEDAINASVDNDTIYIMGSSSNYGNFTLDKPLVLIGAGIWPEISERTRVGTISIDNAGSGSVIKGVDASGIRSASSQEATDLVISYNRIREVHGTLINSVFKNNIFYATASITIGTSNANASLFVGVVFSNNIFFYSNNQTSNNQRLFYTTNSNNVNNILRNNLFFSSNLDNFRLGSLHGFTVQNNIFYKRNSHEFFIDQGWSNCNISHNLFFGEINLSELTGGGSSESNNITGSDQDPQFVDVNDFFHVASLLNYQSTNPVDFELAPSSPAVGTGSNGEDMGIHDGPDAFITNPSGDVRKYFPGPDIINFLEVSVPSVSSPGTININIKARNVY